MQFPFSAALKGPGGEYEISRVLGGFGAIAYCLGANIFVAWQTMYEHSGFDVTAYCLAFPGGLSMIIGAAAGSAAVKDRNAASSKVIERTGVVPSKSEGVDNAST